MKSVTSKGRALRRIGELSSVFCSTLSLALQPTCQSQEVMDRVVQLVQPVKPQEGLFMASSYMAAFATPVTRVPPPLFILQPLRKVF